MEENVSRSLRQQYGIHLLRISTPLPTLRVNIYFVEKPVPTLIDAPPDRPESLEEMETCLNGIGFSIRDIRAIFVTHPHFDHYGCAQTLVEQSGAEVWASKETGEWIRDFDRECIEEEEFNAHMLKRAGVPPHLTNAARQHFRHMKQYARGVPESRVLEPGETIRLSSVTAKTYQVPGHTPWCTMLCAQNEGIAFTGDFLLADISPNPLIQRRSKVPPGYNSLQTYVASLNRVDEMELCMALPGHGPLILQPSKRIKTLLGLIQERRSFVLSAFQYGARTLFDLVEQLFPGLPPAQMFLAISEISAHVGALCAEGALSIVDVLPDRYAVV